MALAKGQDLISIFDLSDREVEAIFSLADAMPTDRRDRLDTARGMTMCTLFYEPSTRTRLSFESAMQHLGGDVLSVPSASDTSVAKGETIADTVRIIQSYADLIVIRHPFDGSARVAADYADIPVINAGDGVHEHPTQTLVDLYTIRRKRGKLNELNVALVGDLLHGRTVHSLAFGLARFGAKVTLVSPPGLEMPDHLITRLKEEFGMRPERYHSVTQIVATHEDAIEPAQVASLFDVIYVTRIQKERFESEQAYERARNSYAITQQVMDAARHDALIMHPLPRVDEVPYTVDADARAAYFDQAAYGLPVRMALVTAILGDGPIPLRAQYPYDYRPRERKPVDLRALGEVHCPNQRCIVNQETYITPRFYQSQYLPAKPLCFYCDQEAVSSGDANPIP